MTPCARSLMQINIGSPDVHVTTGAKIKLKFYLTIMPHEYKYL